MRWPAATTALLSAILACTPSDGVDSASEGASGSAESSSSATSESPTTTAATASTTTATTVGTDSSTTASDDGSSSASTDVDPDTSTGEPGCDPGREPALASAVEGCARTLGEAFCSEGAMHVDQGSVVEWMHDPPHSGPHYPTWESWGEHDDVVPRGNWVHNLEHGGIVLSYRCNGDCDPEIAMLREVIAQRPELRIVLTEDPFLPDAERFAALSWTWVLRFDAPVLDELLCFADQHENHAPEDIP
jgi:Protein of unknown function (DUF3105)